MKTTTNNELIAEFLDMPDVRDAYSGKKMVLPYNLDIGLWHGENGILEVIEEAGLWIKFIVAYEEECLALGRNNTHDWRYLYMNPETSMLSKALVKVIKED